MIVKADSWRSIHQRFEYFVIPDQDGMTEDRGCRAGYSFDLMDAFPRIGSVSDGQTIGVGILGAISPAGRIGNSISFDISGISQRISCGSTPPMYFFQTGSPTKNIYTILRVRYFSFK